MTKEQEDLLLAMAEGLLLVLDHLQDRPGIERHRKKRAALNQAWFEAAKAGKRKDQT